MGPPGVAAHDLKVRTACNPKTIPDGALGLQPPAEVGFLKPGSGSEGPSDRASDLAASLEE